MRKFVSYLDQAERDAKDIEDRCRKAAGMSGPASMLTGGALSVMDSQSRQRTTDSREQQSHYRGQSFISIRPIAQRIAGQPIRLAYIGRPRAKASRFTEPRRYQIPQWVKDWAFESKGYGRNEGELTVVDQHPILDAIHNPTPDVPGWNEWMLKCFTIVNLEITGYGYWWMPVVKGRVQIWPMPSQWVRPISDDQGLFVQWAIRTDGSAEDKTVPREEIAPFWYPDPSNPFRGLGPLEAGAREIMVNEFVVEAQKRSFQLGIHPCAVIKMGSVKLDSGKTVRPRAKQFQIEQVIQAINNRYRGMTHFGQPMVIDRMIESIEPYGNRPKEMDFGSNADSAQSRVEQVYGTNAYVAGASGLGSRAEAGVADANFCYLTVNPKIELLSRVMTMCVIPRFDASGMYMLYVEPARPNDADLEQQQWDSYAKWSRVTINEDRARNHLPPVPWGDAVVVPNGYSIVPVRQLKDGYVPSSATGPTATSDQDAEEEAEENAAAPVVSPEEQDEEETEDGEPLKRRPVCVKVYDDAFYDSYTETWLKVHNVRETNMSDAIVAFLKQQGEDVAKRLEENYGDIKGYDLRHKTTTMSMVNAVFQPDHWRKAFLKAIKEPLVYAIVAGATHELAAFGDYDTVPLPADAPETAKDVGFDINFEFGVDLPADILTNINAAVDDALSKDYWDDIQETTKDRLATALQTSIDAGEDIRATVKRIKDDVFEGQVGRDRAENIARTETTNLLNCGQDIARHKLADDGVVEGKEWFATFDGLTRPTHYAANGQQRDVDEMFDVGGHQAKYPGDPNLPAKERCRCRCVASSVTVFSKRTRAPRVKAVFCQFCEVHGR